jgi:glycosyltransferase involved in cell wall biosynthesis
MPFRILFLDQFSSVGGGQRVLLGILCSLPSGFDSIIAINGCGEFSTTLAAKGLPVYSLPIGNYSTGKKSRQDQVRFSLRTLLCALLVGYRVLRNDVQLIYANGPRTYFCAALAGCITRRCVIWHLHNVLPQGTELRLVVYFSRWVHQILACSNAVTRPLLQNSPGLARKIQVIYNPLPHWNHEIRREQALAEFARRECSPDLTSFGILGRVTSFKGQREFVEAALLVLRQEQAIFWVIGSPSPRDLKDNVYYSDVQREVARARLESSIFFLPHQTDIERCYALLDVVVLAPQGLEGFGLTALEAMSLGKAIIAPALGGIPEILANNETALLVPEASPVLLAQAMLELLQNAQKRQLLAENARRRAHEQFSQTRFANEIGSVLQRVRGATS